MVNHNSYISKTVISKEANATGKTKAISHNVVPVI